MNLSMMNKQDKLSVLVNKIITKVDVKHTYDDRADEIHFYFSDNSRCAFYHDQDCCESVTVDDVNGDWSDLIGSPLLVAEERSEHGDAEYGTETWTFYTFRTVKGSVDVKWYGESNGYYSESVDFVYEETPYTKTYYTRYRPTWEYPDNTHQEF